MIGSRGLPTVCMFGAGGPRGQCGTVRHPRSQRDTSMISVRRKQAVIQKIRTHETDSGSPEVQIAVLTERIVALSEHLQGHLKDNHSRLGLTQMVSRRNRLLKYLAREDKDRYTGLIGKLGLRK